MNLPSSVEPARPPMRPDRYPRTWTVLLVIAVSALFYHWYSLHTRPPVVYTAPAVAGPEVRWYLVLRMPAITAQYESGIDIMKARYDEWLSGLTAAGFHFMRYSDIQDRISSGRGIPQKSILLVFDPGYRKTYEYVAPILTRHQIPALWLSNGTAMSQGNREYATYHTTRQMVASGLWDVGFSQADGSYIVQTREHGTMHLGNPEHGPWSRMAGGLAINRGREHSDLNRLNVISDWTSADLLTRVQAEVPIEEPMALTEGPVQNMIWGVSTPLMTGSSGFGLKTLPYKRGLVLDWYGTRGIPNFQLHAQVKSLVGEFCLRLRWDEERGNGISVLISREQWVVMQLESFHVTHKWRYARRQAAFDALITLSHENLSVTLDGHQPIAMALTPAADPERGLFQLFLIDKFRGSARADGVQLTFSPQE